MQWNIADLPIFAAVVKQGGIAAASRELRMLKSSISRFIHRLENNLNLRRFERNSRQMRLTQEGGGISYKHTQLILEQVEAADAQMSGLSSNSSGDLNVSLPMAFSRLIFSQHRETFYRRYPDINLRITVSPSPLNLINDAIDVAVQVGDLPDSELIAVPLINSPLIWVAHPETARKYETVHHPELLAQAVTVCEKRDNLAALNVRYKGERTTITPSAPVETTDPLMVKDAISHRMGITLLPEIDCLPEVRQGLLVEVAKEIKVQARARVSAVYTSRRMLSSRTRLFIDFLKEICAA